MQKSELSYVSFNADTTSLSESIQTSLGEYSDQISDFISEKEKIDSALEEQAENGSISIKTAFDLSTSGYQSAIQFDKETNSYKLLRNEIDAVAESRRAELKAKLESEKASLIKSNTDELENWRKMTGRSKDDIMYQAKLEKYNEAIQEITDSYDLYISMLEDSDNATSDFSDTISKITDKLDEYKESVESLKNVSSIVKTATEEQNTFGRISADTINSLHEAGLDGAMAYNEMTGETYFLVDAIDELTRAMIDNQRASIEQSITDTTNAIVKAQQNLKNLGTIDSLDDAARALQINQYIGELEDTLSELNLQKQLTTSFQFSFETDTDSAEKSAEEAAEEAAEDYIETLKSEFNSKKSEIEHLLAMDVITEDNYYAQLNELNEQYFANKEDLLDEYRQYEEEIYEHLKQKQIKAIQEQIDALKSVNEEKQEEIDLEKAKQALESAKRNKTISVYDSERGWIRETDRDAIDSAQKEYDDLVLNEKVEVLENLIDAIENGTNTSHSLDESVNAVEQVDGMIDLTKYFKNIDSETLNKMNQIKQSVQTGIGVPETLTSQLNKTIAADSYVVNDNKTMTVNVDKVVVDDPMRFAEQMEQIANERFQENFPTAMNKFGEGLKRYRMNHSF